LIRSFGLQAVSGAAQPCLGDVTTAAFVVPAKGQLATVTVANSAIYQVGDRIILGAGQVGPNILKVVKIPAGGVTLLCESEGDAALKAWVSGTILALSIACFRIGFRTPGNAGLVWLGTDSSVTNAGAGTAFEALGNADRYDYVFHNGQNPLNTAEIWMAGTPPDTVLVSAHIN